MRRAHSYQRCSEARQAKGSTWWRQTVPAEQWCGRNDYTLSDVVFRDAGRSGFSGAHLDHELGRLLDLIEGGVIKRGEVVILDNLDRLARLPVDDSMAICRKILHSGVDIVTLVPERRYTKASLNDLMSLMELQFTFARAHDESRMKSERAKVNWHLKRQSITKDKAIVTTTRPFWLDTVDDKQVGGRYVGGRYVVNSKVEMVKFIFDMADKGFGSHKIRQMIAKKGWIVRRAKVVTQATICRLLASRSVLGEHQAYHKADRQGKRIPVGEVIKGYYPPVIDHDLFARVQLKMKQRRRGGCGRTDKFINLFAGLLFDSRDGAPLYLKPCRGSQFLQNANALKNLGGANRAMFPYAALEEGILQCCTEIDPNLLQPATPLTEILAGREAQLIDTLARIVRAQQRVETAKDVETEEAAFATLTNLIARRKELEKEVESLKAQTSTGPVANMAQLRSMIDVLEGGDEDTRMVVKSLIATLVERIDVYIQRRGKFEKRAHVEISFVNGLKRIIFIQPTSCLPKKHPLYSIPTKAPAQGGKITYFAVTFLSRQDVQGFALADDDWE